MAMAMIIPYPKAMDGLDKMSDLAHTKLTELVPWCFPRRYVSSNNYVNPRYLGANMVTNLLANDIIKPGDTISGALQVLTWQLIKWKVPTYFVAPDFLRAVLATDPPDDMLLDDLQWPAPAVAFMLPLDVLYDYTGRVVPWLAAGFMLKGDLTPEFDLGGFLTRLYARRGLNFRGVQSVENSKDRVVFSWVDMSKDVHADFAGVYPLAYTVKESIQCEAFTDHAKKYIEFTESPASDKANLDFTHQMDSLAIRLLLVMMAKPELVEQHTTPIRVAKVKHGHVRDELWAPNMIGKAYRLHQEEQVGTHASPRFHFRRRHMRYQAHGKGRLERKLIWIEHTWVGELKE